MIGRCYLDNQHGGSQHPANVGCSNFRKRRLHYLHWKKKTDELLKNVPMDDITVLNGLIYTGVKLLNDRIGIKLEGQIKKLQQQT